MIPWVRRYFEFDRHRTSFSKEFVGGLTTFLTTAYIIVLNPAILEAAGIPRGASTIATILAACFGTLVMGVFGKRPLAIAPYMGQNAFVAYTVCGVLGYSWQTALGAIFLGGFLFSALSILGIRRYLIEAIPKDLKYSFAVGIGLFLSFIGLNMTGIVRLGVSGAPVAFGNLSSSDVLLSVFGVILIGILIVRRVHGGMLLGILAMAVLAFFLGVAPAPTGIMSFPTGLEATFMHLNVSGALTWGLISVVLTIFIMDFVDTMGTLIGVSSLGGLLDEKGNLPGIDKPLLVDGVSTMVASILGTTTAGSFIESAAGIEAGARTGFASVVTAGFFFASLFFAPLLTAIPVQAYGPALIIVGFIMLRAMKKIQMEDPTILIPSAVTIALMSFTFNVGIGMTSGFILYTVLKATSGRLQELRPGMYVLTGLSVLFFVFFPQM